MTTPKFAMHDTQRPDGCYVTFERLILADEHGNPEDYLFQDPDYRHEDQARIEAFNAGDWCMVGIRARAYIEVVVNGVATMLSIDSAGCWGIESDSGEDFLASVYEDEKAACRGLIAALANPIYVD